MDMYCQRCGGATATAIVEDRERPVCTQCGWVTYLDPKLAVAVVIERDGALLLGRRGPTASVAGRWSFPAGFVERGEVVEAAAIREVREETGVQIELGPLLGLYSRPGETVVLAAYACRRFQGTPAAGDDLDMIGWYAPDALPEMAFPHDTRIIEDWRAWRSRESVPAFGGEGIS
jgi:8-oxo-dGTP diphosphatase